MRSEAAFAWTDLGEGIRVRQSRACWMNSVLLLDREHAVVVDPGVLPSELDDLQRATSESTSESTTLFFTHAHWDHVLGRSWWPHAHTLAHDGFALEVRRERDSIRADAEALAQEHGETWPRGFEPFAPDTTVSGLRFAKLGNWRVVLRDAPGHSGTQLSLHLPDRRLLVAADMLSDIEIPILDGPCAPYIGTLEALELLAGHGAIETIIPGHGAIADGRGAVLARLARDLDYLRTLETAARKAAVAGDGVDALKDRLDGMDYTGRRSTVYPTDHFHDENIAFAYQGFAATR